MGCGKENQVDRLPQFSDSVESEHPVVNRPVKREEDSNTNKQEVGTISCFIFSDSVNTIDPSAEEFDYPFLVKPIRCNGFFFFFRCLKFSSCCVIGLFGEFDETCPPFKEN